MKNLAIVVGLLLVTTQVQANTNASPYSSATISTYLKSRITDQESLAEREALQQTQANRAPEDEIQPVINNEEILQKLEIKDSVTPETTELLGESINLDTGGISFSNTDVSLPGNFNLPVQIKRTFKNIPGHLGDDYALGDWELDIPMITTDILKFSGFSGSWGEGQACSGINDDAWEGSYGKNFMPHEYWNGDMLSIPGKVNERLVHNRGTFTSTSNFPRITKSGWRVKCFEISHDVGEGFEVHSPDGTIYRMDTPRLIFKGPINHTSRYKFYMLASQVTDRFGNTVTYNYDSRARLTSITASDGRAITLEYNNDVTGNQHRHVITDIKANGRHWQYIYNGNMLTNVKLPPLDPTQPDVRKQWTYNLLALSFTKPQSVMDINGKNDICKAKEGTNLYSISVTHPNGVRGDFELKQQLHGRANVTRRNNHPDTPFDIDTINKCFNAFAVTKKSLHINNQANPYQWNYSYNGGFGYWDSDTPSGSSTIDAIFAMNHLSGYNFESALHRMTTVVSPDGSKTEYIHNRDFSSILDGKLIVTNVYDTNSSTLLKSSVSRFDDTQYDAANPNPNTLPWIGITYVMMDNRKPHTYFDRGLGTDIYQFGNSVNDWSVYKTDFSDFNQYNQARFTTETNVTAGLNRYTRNTYKQPIDSSDLWLLNVLEKSEVSANNSDWKTTKRYTYNENHANNHINWQINEVYQHELLQYTVTEYHTDGNMKKVEFNDFIKNSSGTPTNIKQYVTYNNYKRGQIGSTTMPTRYSDTTTKNVTRSIDDNGWVTRTTDFAGTGINYTYDALGRLATINPDSAAIADTHISWDSIGLTQTTTRCTLSGSNCSPGTELIEVTKTFDALHRPLITETKDIASGTVIKQTEAYNVYNKPTFQSYPYLSSESSKASHGTTTLYDGLQRQIETQVYDGTQTFTQTNSYTDDNKVTATDFNGNSTTTTYLAYGQPQQEQATQIDSAGIVNTSLTTDILGNITNITQSKGAEGFSEVRHYDSNNRLCASYRADIGHSVFGYDDAGKMIWKVDGVTGKTTSSCLTTTQSDTLTKTNYVYDNNGAQWKVNYPTGTDAIEYTHSLNGDLTELKAGNIVHTYGYNTIRQLISEQLNINDEGKSWLFQHSYNTLGHKASTTYPNIVGTVTYAPNAFGQPTQAGSYATNATYHASGALTGFTYGNGIVHNTTLNGRNLPNQITDGSIVNLSYTYDGQSNIKSISDAINADFSVSNLNYDGLDRLISSTGGTSRGNTSLTYDIFGNILTYNTKDKNLTYAYDSNNRLTTVTDASGTAIRNFASGYDSKGNVTANGTQDSNGNNRSFSYNDANQMTNANTNSYRYDGHNRRVVENKNGRKNYSFYNKEGSLVYRETPAGALNYIFLGKKLIAKDGTMPEKASSDRMNYHAFGQTFETPKDDVGYTGHKFDADLNLNYMQARYYDPEIGRFYGNDPVGYTPKNPVMSFNRYLYVNNNPYKYTDPDGEFINWLGGALIGGVSNAVYQYATTGTINTGELLTATAVGAVIGGTFGASTIALAGETIALTTSETILVNTAAGILSGTALAVSSGNLCQTECHSELEQKNQEAENVEAENVEVENLEIDEGK